MEELTDRQGDALQALAGYIRAHKGVSPSLEDMARLLGVATRSVAVAHMNALENRGMVTSIRDPASGHRYARTWRITERGMAWCKSTSERTC